MPFGDRADRATIALVRTGEVYSCLFNPASLTLGASQSLARDALPGASHELVRWMSSKEKDISLSLMLDAELALRNRGRQMLNDLRPDAGLAQQEGDGGQFSLQAEIDFLMSLPLPEDPRLPGADGPPRLVFSMGTAVRGQLCTAADVSVNVTEFSMKLAPTKATVTVSLARIVTNTIFRDTVFRSGGRL
jgi:hypothetical protein